MDQNILELRDKNLNKYQQAGTSHNFLKLKVHLNIFKKIRHITARSNYYNLNTSGF